MPYEISTDAAGCTNGYAVVKQDDGTLVPGGCHPTEKEALAHLAALEIATKDEDRADDGYTPTSAMVNEAQRGLDWRKQYNRGGTLVGVARARDIVNRKNLPIETVRRMRSFFARHEIDKQAEGFKPGEDGYPSAGRIAWALWGGDAGKTWADRIVESADNEGRNKVTNGLPDNVISRMDEQQRSRLIDTRNTKRGKVEVEVRLAPAPQFTITDTSWNLRGYATVYDVAYPIAGGPEAGGWLEIVERGATAKSIKDGADVRLLFDHDGIPLARTASGTMQLLSDDMGMMVDAQLDPESPYAQSVRSAINRGDADQMSFAFRVLRQSWNEDYTERRIKEVQLFDASVVTYPASEATVVQMNSNKLDSEQRELDPEKEAMEDTIADQIRMLIGRLIEGEAQEMQSGSPVAKSLKALVDTLCALDWWQEVDHAEDSGAEMEMEYESEDEDEEMEMEEERTLNVSVSLAQAQAELLRLRAQNHAV